MYKSKIFRDKYGSLLEGLEMKNYFKGHKLLNKNTKKFSFGGKSKLPQICIRSDTDSIINLIWQRQNENLRSDKITKGGSIRWESSDTD